MERKPHTWEKGLDYEVVENTGHIILAYDQGQIVVLRPEEKPKVVELFDAICPSVR